MNVSECGLELFNRVPFALKVGNGVAHLRRARGDDGDLREGAWWLYLFSHNRFLLQGTFYDPLGCGWVSFTRTVFL